MTKKLNLKPTHKQILTYYAQLEKFKTLGISHEMAVKDAFSEILKHCSSQFDWTLIPEYKGQYKTKNISIDGALVDEFNLTHGFWEAKDIHDNLDIEIVKKFKAGYPKNNILFQTPKRAVLYQDGNKIIDDDILTPIKLINVLTLFFEYLPPEIEQWEKAVIEFKEKIPELAKGLIEKIADERKNNKDFIAAFNEFYGLCKVSINPNLSQDAVIEMLIQHLMTERIFSQIFNNPDFSHRNVIAIQIEKVIDALTAHAFSRPEFLSKLDRFYSAIELAAKSISDFSEKQGFLNKVYENFFQGFSVKTADTHGIVYTPQPIVDFMVLSVEDILQKEFNKSLSSKGVHILDPFVGTGNFILNVMRRINKFDLRDKYESELHCNEVMLLPYYIASMNIEHEYLDLIKEYKPFNGLCLVDTFELAEDRQMSFFSEENTKRVNIQKKATITVIIGNPPYNTGQVNENDNNKNRKYKVIDERVNETYAKDSKATLVNKLSDPYVKAIRWASDRIGDEGIVALVTNNGFIDGIAFDGMRKHLERDFTSIYILNLEGNVRKDSMRDGIPIGEKNTVFGLSAMVGISVSFFVKTKKPVKNNIYYYAVDWKATRLEKFDLIEKAKSINKIDWQDITPDKNNTWLTEGLENDFDCLMPMGTKEAKASKDAEIETIFKAYSCGVVTARDSHVYSFNIDDLKNRVENFIEIYNATLEKVKRKRNNEPIEDFIDVNDNRIKWTRQVKRTLSQFKYSVLSNEFYRASLYRPFMKMNLYFDDFWNEERYQLPKIFPTPETEAENQVICLSEVGSNKPFHCIVTKIIPDFHITESSQCFPFYTYNTDGTNRHENITDWSLTQFREHYKNDTITKWDIFYYIYAVLHNPNYRNKYSANLRRSLPHIPFYPEFKVYANAGKELADLHINYENQSEYPLNIIENKDVPFDLRVEKMRLTPDKTSIKYNDFLSLTAIPEETFNYRLGNRSALEWIIDQYQVKTDKRSGIKSDPNRADDPKYIIRLIGQVITVSLNTMKIIKTFPD